MGERLSSQQIQGVSLPYTVGLLRYWAQTHDMPAMVRYLDYYATAIPWDFGEDTTLECFDVATPFLSPTYRRSLIATLKRSDRAMHVWNSGVADNIWVPLKSQVLGPQVGFHKG
ncbi:hypothetical protein TNCV_1694861 [Trichonephila clavipes]|nr:hypothetical protein TNCV_1694861 [Trichonephila clavipes]